MSDKTVLSQLRIAERQLDQTQVKEVPGPYGTFKTLYETGNFTPAWVGAGTAGTFTYTANATLVEWTRIANRVFFNGRIVITAIGVAPVGNLSITGWPYAGVSDANMAIAGGGTMIFWAFNVAAGYTDVSIQAANGSSSFAVLKSGDNLAPASVTGAELIVGESRFFGQYRVA